MRARLLASIALAIGPSAHADSPTSTTTHPTDLADVDLLSYVADAEARAASSDETIVVDDTAPVDTPTSGVRVVTARQLELTPHKNADDLLRVVPGLYMSQHGSEGKGQQFFLRGFDAVHGSDLSIRVNGIPINEMSNVHGQGYADLGFVIPETVAGITSRKGPFDLEQGWFATAGSIDLELGVAKRGRSAGYEIGSTNRHTISLLDAPSKGPQAEFVAADVMHDDGYGEGRGTEKGSLIAQTELTAGRVRLRPMITGYWSQFGEPGVIALDDLDRGYYDRDSAPAGDLGGTSRRMMVGLGTQWHHGANEVVSSSYLGWHSLQLAENFTGFLENAELGDTRAQMHRAITGGGRVAWRHRLAPNLRLLAGGELLRDQLVQGEQRVSTAGVVWRDERELAASTTTLGTWAGAEVRRGRWTLVGGARVDAMHVDATDMLEVERSGNGNVASVSPKVALAWRSAGGSFSIAAGRGARPPEARAFTQRLSRENMDTKVFDGGEPEITMANAVEIGGELRREAFAVGATGFATWIERESVFDHVSGLNALRDGSRRLGGELFVEATPWPWLALRADATAVDARFVVTENPVPGAPRLLASGEVRFDRKPWSAGLAGRFLGARPLTHGATAAASTVFDAVGGYVHGPWTFSLQIDNLLATKWNEGEYHFASHWDPSTPSTEIPRVHISPGRPFGVRAGVALQF